MSKQVRFRRGTTAQHATFTGADCEVTVDTTKRCIVLHDGVTAGGKPFDDLLRLNPGAPLSVQEIKTAVAITGGDSDGDAFSVVNPSRFSGDVTTDSDLLARRLRFQNKALVYAASVNVDFASFTQQQITLSGDLSFTATNMGLGRQVVIRIKSDGSVRTLAFPVGWVFVGGAAPANIAANKTAILVLRCYGTTEADVVAQYAVQP